jgi:hypothetical protein
VHFREILSGYFLFSRFDWSIFVTQLVAKHMKEIIRKKLPKKIANLSEKKIPKTINSGNNNIYVLSSLTNSTKYIIAISIFSTKVNIESLRSQTD